MSNAVDYPRRGSTVSADSIDALLSTLETWRNDRGPRLVDLDERAQLRGTDDQRDAIDLAFVMWTAIGVRIEDLRRTCGRGRASECRETVERIWAPVVDDEGGPLTGDLPAAVNGVEDIWRRVEQIISADESHDVELVARRAAIAADLETAERLSTSLGDQVRHVAELRERFADITAAGRDSDLVTAELDELETSLRGTVDDLTAADDERRRMLAALATNDALVEQLRAVEANMRTLAQRCRDRIADPPNLAVPSVDALGPAPDIDALPWPRASSMIQTRLDRTDRVRRALQVAHDAYDAPLSRRDELRGLLEAYRDKADDKGLAEAVQVDAAFQAARTLLWTAPCDIDDAERLVGDYQRLVNDSPRVIDT